MNPSVDPHEANLEAQSPPPDSQKPKRPRRFMLGVIITLLLVAAALLAWMYLPVLNEVISGTATPSPLPPTVTASPTATPTITPTHQPTALPSATLLPPSAYRAHPDTIFPRAPGIALDAVILNEDLSVTADPSFDHPQWYSAEQISQQIGVVIGEPFFATIGPGTVTWKMDLPLQLGLYELYILDTLYSSAGSLDFKVFLGQRELFPLLGIQHVQYGLISGVPAQVEDEWRSIGLYQLDAIDLLSVTTAWETREMSTIVAIDRLLIAQQPTSILEMIAQLPENTPKFVVDDAATQIDSRATWFTRSDLPAWGDELQMVVNPEENSQITWTIPGRVPPGQYDVWVWAAKMQGDADLLYKVLVNGMENQGAVVASTGNMPANQWVSLGTWQAQREQDLFSTEEEYVQLGLRLEIAQGTPGEIAIDAVAFILRQ